MHIRTSRVRSNGKVYEYAQLVESYRRESDGMPMHRVLASVPEGVAAQNLRDALAAARLGKRVAVARPTPPTAKSLKPTANLQYLDLAVLLELWREMGLASVLDELMPIGDATLPAAAVVAALTLQRCVDPGSKLGATRWLPRTALPELLHIAPTSFNNTRLHRVLDELDDVTPALMAKLPARYLEREGKFASLFMDASDAWFVGQGPSFARVGKTKEGMVQRKIGILLLCNEHGYPLRWDVFEGTQHDSIAMTRMLTSVSRASWASEVPIVCDRAMGKTAQIREMLATELRFLTALTVDEFDSYATNLPHQPFAELGPSADAAVVARHAEQAGMLRVRDDLFVLDLGTVQRDDAAPRPINAHAVADAAVEAIRYARQIREAVGQGRFASIAAAGRSLGLGRSVTIKYCALSTLSEQQQRDVLDGRLRATLTDLLQVAQIKDDARRDEAFDALLQAPPPKLRFKPSPQTAAPAAHPQPVRVRAVVYFNPERFVDQRRRAREQLAEIEAFTSALNAKLQARSARYTQRSIEGLVDRRLREDTLLEAFDVRVTKREDDKSFSVEVVLNKADWARRRRYDGFTVLVGHPDLPQSPVDLCELYRAKDAVEKDFQVIKSVVELRPVRHRDDAKVRAHVTLCMLALLLERTLNRHLAKRGVTSRSALETLAPCHLNLFKANDAPGVYASTHLDTEQRALLRGLRMLQLADDDALAEAISPR